MSSDISMWLARAALLSATYAFGRVAVATYFLGCLFQQSCARQRFAAARLVDAFVWVGLTAVLSGFAGRAAFSEDIYLWDIFVMLFLFPAVLFGSVALMCRDLEKGRG